MTFWVLLVVAVVCAVLAAAHRVPGGRLDRWLNREPYDLDVELQHRGRGRSR